MARSFELKAIISAVDKMSPVLKNIQRATRVTHKSIMDIGGASRQLSQTVTGIMAPLSGMVGALGLGGLGTMTAGVVRTSAEFEKFQAILESIEGSSEKARSSMGWVSDFAKKTPYEIGEVTDAFVKLKAYGIDPQSGALQAAGNAAAGLSKPIEQTVEALADAMNGEMERMKELGFVFEKTSNFIYYRWEENGKKMAARARKDSKEQIQAMVTGLWNKRFGDAMEKRSATFDGIVSNIKGGFTDLQLAIGKAGLFDFIKGEVQGVLNTLNRMAADGSLQRIAKEISDNLVGALKELKPIVKDTLKWLKDVDLKGVIQSIKGVVSALGGVKGIALGFEVLIGAQLLAPFALMTAAIGKMGIAYGTLALQALVPVVPLGTLTAAMSTATTAALALLAPLAKVAAAGAVGYGIGTLINDKVINPAVQKMTGDKSASLGTWLYDKIHGDEEAPLPLRAPAESRSRFVAVGAQRLTGSLDININGAPPGARVGPVRTNQSGFSINADVGYSPAYFGMP